MSIKERIAARLEEQKKTVFDDLISKGGKDITAKDKFYTERKFSVNLDPTEVEKILSSNRFVKKKSRPSADRYVDSRWDVTAHLKNEKVWKIEFFSK